MDTILQAIKLVENDQIEEGLKLLKGYVGKANDDEKYTIAELYLQWGFLEEASLILKELLQKYPDETDLKLSLVDIYIETNDDESAISLLADVTEDDPEYVQALLQLADLYQSQGLFEVAEQKLLTAKNKLPTEIIIDFALGELYFSIGEYLKAITYYEKVAAQHQVLADISIDDRLGESFAGAGEYEKALTYFKVDDDDNPDRFFKYGVTAYQANRNDIAIKAWKHVLEFDEHYHSVYYNLANVLEEEGMPEEAYEIAEKGLSVDNFNKELFLLAGTLAHQLKQPAVGEDYVRQAISLDPDYKEAILFLIEFLKEQSRFTEIVDLIKEIKTTGSEDSLYDWELARAYNEEEQFVDATEAYRDAYLNLKDDGEFLKEYGYFLTEDGQIPEAIPIFENYLRLTPQDSDIEEFLARLKQSDQL